ncbi:Nramp family divalent metal transporter [Candidatus Dependentiae bacterium]|nr:Nramp family divalent metal transporter [Candidatus Dependentiae bacterium]
MNYTHSKLFLYFKRFLSFVGPGYLVAVGYMDPGNWVTGIAAGSGYGYTLLSVIFISNIMAILLQHCALKLGVVTGKDLARMCRDRYSRPVSLMLWILAELAIIATDLAEVIGSALGLKLLFGIPLIWGVCITAADVLLLLIFAQRRKKTVEIVVAALIAVIFICFAIIIYLARPEIGALLQGFIPTLNIIRDPNLLYLAIGILGATVMPHNLYLHSALVKDKTSTPKKESILFYTIDLCIALTWAFFVNAAILIVAASVFYKNGIYEVAELQDAYALFTPILNTTLASFVFALALLISGQNSTLTGTLAGQIIMEGFINFSIPAWLRRLLGRLIAIIPALIGIIFYGECCLASMMIFSQIILSLQLPFAIFPLIRSTGDKNVMGAFANSKALSTIVYSVGITIIVLNALLIYRFFI